MSQIKIKQIEGLQIALDAIDARLESGSLKSTYRQKGHDFVPGSAISYTNGSWVLADSSTAENLGRLVVESVTVDEFVAVQIGNIEVSGWGLNPGKFYVVDSSGFGTIAEYDSPEAPDFLYSNPIIQALTEETAQVLPWRPSLGAQPLSQGVEFTQADLIPNFTDGNRSSTGITLEYTPFANSTVQVFINGIAVTESYGEFSGDCYFSADGGVTAKNVADLSAGDVLYWNANVAGYNIGEGDMMDLVYEKNTLD